MSGAATIAAGAGADEVDPTTRFIATVGLVLATLTNTLDMTIANVALPHIQGSVSASQDQLTWVLTSYMVATAIMIPFSGWLSNRVGRKRLFLLSTFFFMCASILCGAATTLPEIVVFRVLQGLAGASLMPMSQAAMLDLWPMEKMPQVMSVWSAVVTAAPVIGPTLGGYLTDTLSWRWAFYINVPLDIVAIFIVWSFLPADAGGERRRLDMIGFFALICFTVGTQLFVDRGSSRDWFDSIEIRGEAIIAALGAYIFLVQTVTARAPFFPRALFRDRNFITSQVLGLLLSTSLYATSALVPVMMQTLMGYSALESGLATMPRGIGSVLGFFFAPQVAAMLGARRTVVLGMLINGAALWQMGHFDLSMTAESIRVTGFMQGLGSALVFNPIAVISYSTITGNLRNEAATFSNMIRSVGGSLGIAMYSVLQIRLSAEARSGLVAHLEPTNPAFAGGLDALSDPGGLTMLDHEVARQASMIAYDNAYGLMCLSMIFLVPLLFLLRPGSGIPAKEQPLDLEPI